MRSSDQPGPALAAITLEQRLGPLDLPARHAASADQLLEFVPLVVGQMNDMPDPASDLDP